MDAGDHPQLPAGRIIERGAHEELMKAAGRHEEMVRRRMESHGEVTE